MIEITTDTNVIGCPNTTNSGIITVEGECRYCNHLDEIYTKHQPTPVITIKCNYIVTDD